MVKRIGFWNRMSHMNSVDRESHVNHRMRAEEFCKFHDFKIVKEYSLLDVAGSKIREHRAYYEMKNDVRAGTIDALLVTGLKRFARKVKILVEEIQFLQENKVDFISMNESIDTTTPYGKFFFHLIAALAELESDEVSERIKASIKPRAERGVSLGGSAPWGYKYVDKKYVVDATVPVKDVFDTFLRVGQMRPTCRVLTEKGIFARKGPFTTTTLNRVLRDEIYIGRHWRNRRGSTQGKIYHKGESDWILNAAPRLLDDITWHKSQALLKRIRHNQPPKKYQNTYLLSWVLKHDCGGKLYGSTRRTTKGLHQYYQCKKCGEQAQLQRVNKAILDSLKDVILRSDYIEERVRACGG